MTTPNLALQMVPTGTLEPSVPLNDALQVLDALVRPGGIVQSRSVTATPTTTGADVGKRWIVPVGASGAWSTNSGKIALCTAANVWRYFAPTQGWRSYVLDENADVVYSGTAWAASSLSAAAPVTALSIASGVVNIDLALGDYFTLNLTANVTSITFSNLPASGNAKSIALRIKQDATGGRTVALPASFKATGGSDTSPASAANAYSLLTATTFDQGTRWEYAMQECAA